jgi:hypothetical protein
LGKLDASSTVDFKAHAPAIGAKILPYIVTGYVHNICNSSSHLAITDSFHGTFEKSSTSRSKPEY